MSDNAPRPWVMPLLVVSLALNLLVAGAIGAMLYHHFAGGAYGARPGATSMNVRDMRQRMAAMRHDRPARLGRPGLMLIASWRLLRELPRERRKALRQVIRQRRGEIRRAYAKVAGARARLAQILAGEPFDEAAYAEAMNTLREADTAARAKAVALADAFIRALTPQERRLYAREIRKAAERRRGRWRGR